MSQLNTRLRKGMTEAEMMRVWFNIVVEAGLAPAVTTEMDVEQLLLQLINCR